MKLASDDDDRLQAMLRESAPPLPDVGFSDRVMLALPHRKRARLDYLRAAACLTGALCGLLFASQRDLSAEGLQTVGVKLNDSLAQAAGTLSNGHLYFAILVTILSVAYSFRKNPRRIRNQ